MGDRFLAQVCNRPFRNLLLASFSKRVLVLKEAKSNSEMAFWVGVSRFGLHTPTKNFEHASPNSKAQQSRQVE